MPDVGAQVFQYFRAHGLSPAQSAGIVGNFQQESSLNPQSPGGGLDQGQGTRYHPGSLGHQLQAILGELQGPERGTLQALKGASSPRQAALIFSQKFERPGIPNNPARERYASEALHRYGGLAGANISGEEGSTQSAGTHAGPAKPVEQTAAQSAGLMALVSALQGAKGSSTSPAGIPVGSAQPGLLAPVRDLGSPSSGPSPSELLALVSNIGTSPAPAESERVPNAPAAKEPASPGKFAGGGSVPNAKGGVGFTPAAGTDYAYGHASAIANRANKLAQALGLKLTGISGYRTPAHSVAVGGFADDPHTKGEASDTPGVENVPEATLNKYGLERPFDKIVNGHHSDPAEADHIQLLGSHKS